MKRRAAYLALFAALLLTRSPAFARPNEPGSSEIFRFEPDDVVETHPSPGGGFLVHYTRAGVNAVPSRDVAGEPGVPDHVEEVAAIYDEVLALFVDELGYLAPLSDRSLRNDGGDPRFDVYLLDFGGRADGAFRVAGCGVDGALPIQCAGYIVQENDFAGYGYPSRTYANRLLASHELFHAVQAAYDSNESSVVREGTAVWASAAFDATLRDLEAFAGGYLDRPDRPLDRPLPGPVDPFSYGSGIVFAFLEERRGPDLLRDLWEACVEREFLDALDTVLAERGSSLAEELAELAIWNLYTADRADPERSYSNGAAYPRVAIQSVTLPLATAPPLRLFHASTQYFGAPPGGRSRVAAALEGDVPRHVRLRLALRYGSAIVLAPELEAEVEGADEVIALVTNTAGGGESARPVLCLGDPAEVARCVNSDPTLPDAGVALDGGSLEGDAGTAPSAPVGCACGVGTGPRAPRGLVALGALGALAAARRRGRAAVGRAPRTRRAATTSR